MCGKELWVSKRSRILAIRKESFNETALFPLYCKMFFIDGKERKRLLFLDHKNFFL